MKHNHVEKADKAKIRSVTAKDNSQNLPQQQVIKLFDEFDKILTDNFVDNEPDSYDKEFTEDDIENAFIQFKQLKDKYVPVSNKELPKKKDYKNCFQTRNECFNDIDCSSCPEYNVINSSLSQQQIDYKDMWIKARDFIAINKLYVEFIQYLGNIPVPREDDCKVSKESPTSLKVRQHNVMLSSSGKQDVVKSDSEKYKTPSEILTLFEKDSRNVLWVNKEDYDKDIKQKDEEIKCLMSEIERLDNLRYKKGQEINSLKKQLGNVSKDGKK